MVLFASIITLLGAIFLFLGAVGVLRMPDVYNRMQAGTKATTMGSMLSLLGIGIAITSWLPKLIILIMFILITNPLSSHALARAAHYAGVKLTPISLKDDLQEDEAREEQDA